MELGTIIQFNTKIAYSRKTRVTSFRINKTMIQIGYNNTWVWVAIEPIHNLVLGVYLSSRHINMIVAAAESFLKSLVKSYGKHIVYSDGGWDMVPEACSSSSLGLKHILHSFVV